MPTFRERLSVVSEANRSLLCVGLDPDPTRMPIGDVVAFNSAIVDATCDLVCAYKPNVGFYESRGSEGIRELERTVAHIRDVAPSVMVLIDGKRGDIGSTNAAYAKGALRDVGRGRGDHKRLRGRRGHRSRSWPTRARPCSCGAGRRTRVRPNCRTCRCSRTARRCHSTKRWHVERSSGARGASGSS